MKKLVLLTAFLTCIAAQAFSHCEIPCGIYGDEMRFEMIREHITTIEKAMNQITELSMPGKMNPNQLARWVANKESHATKLQHIVTQYFMTQRVKFPKDGDDEAQMKYANSLKTLHAMLVFAMKTKQTTDIAYVEKLRSLTDAYYTLYFGKEHEEHKH